MCRWLAYTGSPVLLEQALYTPAHSLIDQSLHSRLGAETTNGDDFVLAVDESLYPEINGRADTELLFHLAPTFGLEDDPPEAMARAIGRVEECGTRRGVEYPFQGTIATSNGEQLWAFRHSSEGKSRSLFFSRDVRTLRELYPERQILRDMSDDARLVVSEPIGDLPGAWNEMPEGSCGIAGGGEEQLRPFRPRRPGKSAAVPA